MTERDYVMIGLIVLIIILAIMLVFSLWNNERILQAWAIDQAYWIQRVKELSR